MTLADLTLASVRRLQQDSTLQCASPRASHRAALECSERFLAPAPVPAERQATGARQNGTLLVARDMILTIRAVSPRSSEAPAPNTPACCTCVSAAAQSHGRQRPGKTGQTTQATHRMRFAAAHRHAGVWGRAKGPQATE